MASSRGRGTSVILSIDLYAFPGKPRTRRRTLPPRPYIINIVPGKRVLAKRYRKHIDNITDGRKGSLPAEGTSVPL